TSHSAAFLRDDIAPAADRDLARHAAELNQHAVDARDPAPTPVLREIPNIFSYLGEKGQIRPRRRSGKFRIPPAWSITLNDALKPDLRGRKMAEFRGFLRGVRKIIRRLAKIGRN